MGHKVQWKIGMLIHVPASSRPLRFLQKEALIFLQLRDHPFDSLHNLWLLIPLQLRDPWNGSRTPSQRPFVMTPFFCVLCWLSPAWFGRSHAASFSQGYDFRGSRFSRKHGVWTCKRAGPKEGQTYGRVLDAQIANDLQIQPSCNLKRSQWFKSLRFQLRSLPHLALSPYLDAIW